MVGGRRSPRGARLVVQERTRRAAAVGGFGLAGDAASGFENSKFDPQRPSNAAHTWTEGSVLLCRTGVPQIPAVFEIRRFPIIKIAPAVVVLWHLALWPRFPRGGGLGPFGLCLAAGCACVSDFGVAFQVRTAATATHEARGAGRSRNNGDTPMCGLLGAAAPLRPRQFKAATPGALSLSR